MLLIAICKMKLISGLYHTLSPTVTKFFTDIYNKQLQNLKHVNRHGFPKTICCIKRCPSLPFRVEHKLDIQVTYSRSTQIHMHAVVISLNAAGWGRKHQAFSY